jgi:hypothetical protein
MSREILLMSCTQGQTVGFVIVEDEVYINHTGDDIQAPVYVNGEEVEAEIHTYVIPEDCTLVMNQPDESTPSTDSIGALPLLYGTDNVNVDFLGSVPGR